MNVIVTGGAGFLGSHVVEELISQKHSPIIIDNFSNSDGNTIRKFVKEKKAKLIKLDVRNFNQVKKLPKASAVIHLAAVASISESYKNPKYVSDVNINGTLNMLEFCKIQKIKKFIFISSASVFGDADQKVSEKIHPEPTNLYGTTKLIGEHLCKIYSSKFGINCVVLRPFNIYGPRQNKEYAPVIPKFLSQLKANKPPKIFGTGKQTRDFINVLDASCGIILALKYKRKPFSIFHLASGKSIKIIELAKIMIKLSHNSLLKPQFKKGDPGVSNSSTSITLIRKELGFVPCKNLKTELGKLISQNY